MRVGLRWVVRTGVGVSVAVGVVLAGSVAAQAAGGVFDQSGPVQVVGSTVVVTAGAVEQLDMRWKLAAPAPALAVVVPVPAASPIQGANSSAARAAASSTAPQPTSFLTRPWILAGDGAGDAIAAQDALRAPTQQVRVSKAAVVAGDDLAAALSGLVPGMTAGTARGSAALVVQHALPGSRYAVALLESQTGSQLRAGWVGTVSLTMRGTIQVASALPAADGSVSQVSVPLPGGVLGARGPQVLAVTADTTMSAATGDNVAPVVTGIDRAADGRWQSVLYGQGGGQTPAVDVVQASDIPGPFHAVQPVLLPQVDAWPWILAAAALLLLAAVVLVLEYRRHRQPS